ncbi:thioredoxin family protein [Polaribacter sejongensis]|uniref:thioredoxin family protein n=1 Tax=Polaribacter sejongensis TaxID=985043 RepID=UPI0035A66F3D
MKKHIALVAFFLISISTTIAQEWQTDLTVAKEIATKESKPIILVFQGSDWCAPCIKLDHQIWSTTAFKQYSKDNYVMLQADFPKRKKNALSDAQTAANAKLAETYNKNGIFPFVVVLNSKGKVLGETRLSKNYTRRLYQGIELFYQLK